MKQKRLFISVTMQRMQRMISCCNIGYNKFAFALDIEKDKNRMLFCNNVANTGYVVKV